MLHKRSFKKSLILGIMALALCLPLATAPVWALDSDRDGLDDTLEETGFFLSPGLVLWESTPDAPLTWINGSNNCSAACLNKDQVDLFVIVRLDPATLLDSTKMEEYFGFVTESVANDGLGWNKVWVLKELSPTFPANRRITLDSPQLAPLLIEDLNPNQIAQGLSQYGSIMIPDKGVAWFYSQKTVDDIDDACSADPTNCRDASGASYNDDTETGLEFRHFKWLLPHEALHVLFELDNDLRGVEGHHVTRGDYVMKPAVVVTEKKGLVTYYIPNAFSNTARENFKFYE